MTLSVADVLVLADVLEQKTNIPVQQVLKLPTFGSTKKDAKKGVKWIFFSL